jgi:hypothetical protein
MPDQVPCVKVVGFRVRSGFAVAAVVDALPQSWNMLECRRLALAPQKGRYARFPYHPLIELEGPRGAAKSRSAVADVRRVARGEVAALLAAIRRVSAAVIVGGSLIDPQSIGNPHIRVHAREGQLFRDVIARVLHRERIKSEILSGRDVFAKVAAKLSWPELRLRTALTQTGRGKFRPWGADEKLALLGALWRAPAAA